MPKRYLIYGSILLLGLVVIPIIIKNNRTKERSSTDSKYKMQCKALTSAGQRCKRKPLPGEDFCWQHQSQRIE